MIRMGLAALVAISVSTAILPNPASASNNEDEVWLDLKVDDPARERTIPIRVYLPASGKTASVVIFSHGLGGSRRSFSYLGRAWSENGYCAVFVQHPGSDETILAGLSEDETLNVLRAAAGRENFTLRIADILAVLDQLSEWRHRNGHPLYGQIQTDRVGVAGHSFGAITSQALAGQRFGFGIGRAHFGDERIAAALMLSPSTPISGSKRMAFSRVDRPWMLITGTEDYSAIAAIAAAERRTIFPYLPTGGKYELVLHGAGHDSYDQRPSTSETEYERYRQLISELTTTFWKAWLDLDADARDWLGGDAPREMIGPRDGWRGK